MYYNKTIFNKILYMHIGKRLINANVKGFTKELSLSWTFKNKVVDKVPSRFLLCVSCISLYLRQKFLSYIVVVYAYLFFFLTISEDWTLRGCICLVQFHICIQVLCSIHISHLLNICRFTSSWTWIHASVAYMLLQVNNF